MPFGYVCDDKLLVLVTVGENPLPAVGVHEAVHPLLVQLLLVLAVEFPIQYAPGPGEVWPIRFWIQNL